MTAIRDRQRDPDADDVPVPWDERQVIGARRGLTWWAAVLVGFGLALLGAFVNEMLQTDLGLIFQGCYFVGAVGAVATVQRRGLFGPMVQPPLVLAITVPVTILLTTASTQSDMLAQVVSVGKPLINGFPTMAITTGATLLLGLFRIYRERDPDAPVKLKSGAKPERRRPDDEARPARPRGEAGRGRPAGSNRTGQTPLPASSRTGQTPVPPGRRRGQDDTGQPPRRGRPAPEDAPRRTRDPGTRGTRKPPPDGTRQPRAPRPQDGEPPRRRGEPRADGTPGAPRRRPPGADDPGSDGPRRAPRRGEPRRGRPWDDEQ
ncbi:DUF6542 domain-containing protein [Amycolatopsis sp. H20-H5]|uniref:DUF6542 domain-containing protein n=1 Tax=Amycolatopsis sp. H20-H5 TaxID=3046309 RepID=UPI002DBB7807|nr:DUF6542 domain-containing protein [Amycolatopsis sp. H20-H5]MEC3981351.1 DUF6542 domain-containing protein [Amycolatopsis sp. H20-H5]